jgi:hypothetical protein
VAVFAMSVAGCERLERQVSYGADVEPILDRACRESHAIGKQGFAASGLSVASHEDLMRGTRFGPVVLAGDADSSVLVQLIEGRANPSLKMPHGDESLYPGEIETFLIWVSQGAVDN